jgi:hypothetical protein
VARLAEERPVPTVPFPAPDFPLAGERPTSQSSPTLSVTRLEENEQAAAALGVADRGGPNTDRQPARAYAQAVAEAREARHRASEQRQLGKWVLIFGLSAAGVVAAAILIALLR